MRAAVDLVMFRRIIVVVVDDGGVVVIMVVVVVLVVVVVVVVLREVEGLLPESFILSSAGSSSKITKDFPLFKFPCHINFILPCSKIQFE